MYTVYISKYLGNDMSTISDEVCLYDTRCPNDKNAIIDPVVDLQDSSAGSFSFSMPVSNDFYGRLQKMKTIVRVERDDGKTIFEGRILSDESDFNNNIDYTCEGAMAYLNDVIQPQKDYRKITIPDYINALLENHNRNLSDSYMKFKAGTITVVPPSYDSEDDAIIDYIYTDLECTWHYFTELQAIYGGHFILHKNDAPEDENDPIWIIDYIRDEDLPRNETQEVAFGENLMDFVESHDLHDICTVVLPIGTKTESKKQSEYVPGESIVTTTVNSSLLGKSSDSSSTIGNYSSTPPLIDMNGYKVFVSSSHGEGGALVPYVENGINKIYVSYRTHIQETTVHPAISPETEIAINCDTPWVAFDNAFVPIAKGEARNTLAGFVSAYYEEIDLSSPVLANACYILLGVFGEDSAHPYGIYRDAPSSSYTEQFTVEDADADEYHAAGNIYVVNQDLVDVYGRLEKKMSFDVDDSIEYIEYDLSGNDPNVTVLHERRLGRRSNEDEGIYRKTYVPDQSLLTITIWANAEDKSKSFLDMGIEELYVSYRHYRYDSETDPDNPDVTIDFKGTWVAYYDSTTQPIEDDRGYLVGYGSSDKYTVAKDEKIDFTASGMSLTTRVIIATSDNNFVPKVKRRDKKKKPNMLLAYAEKWLLSTQWETAEINVKAYDLHNMNVDYDSIDISTQIHVTSSPHIMDSWFPVESISIPINSPEDADYTFGRTVTPDISTLSM